MRETLPPASTPTPTAAQWLWIWGPALIQMAAIFVMSSIPDLTELPGGVSDKFGHGVGYLLLGSLLLRAFARASWTGVSARTAAIAWIASAIYGASDEGHQFFVHGRSPAVDDWVADIIGAGLAVVIVYGIARGVAAVRARSRAV